MLRRHGGGRPLRLAKHGAVEASVIEDLRSRQPDLAEGLFREATVAEDIVWFWRVDINTSAQRVGQVSDE